MKAKKIARKKAEAMECLTFADSENRPIAFFDLSHDKNINLYFYSGYVNAKDIKKLVKWILDMTKEEGE